MKICNVCNVQKPLELFSYRKDSGKHRSECKACQAEYSKKYRIKNINTIKEQVKAKYHANAEERKAKAKEFYKENAEYIKQRSNKYYQNNKQKALERFRDYSRDRRKTDPLYRSIRNLRNRIWYALKNKMWKKTSEFSKYIGLDNYQELKTYLESKFADDMTWDNYGSVWEIDHIYPLSLAKTEEELYKLCHYNNLQPLLKAENRSKANKIKKEPGF